MLLLDMECPPYWIWNAHLFGSPRGEEQCDSWVCSQGCIQTTSAPGPGRQDHPGLVLDWPASLPSPHKVNTREIPNESLSQEQGSNQVTGKQTGWAEKAKTKYVIKKERTLSQSKRGQSQLEEEPREIA